jgi:hypothetical protein
MDPPIYRHCFYNTRSPESVCDTFTDLKDPAREEPVHNIFMYKVLENTNQGTPSKGDSCAFPISETLVSL